MCRAERFDASRPSLLMISCKLRRCWTPLISPTSLCMFFILRAISPPNPSIKSQMSTSRTRITILRSPIDGIRLKMHEPVASVFSYRTSESKSVLLLVTAGQKCRPLLLDYYIVWGESAKTPAFQPFRRCNGMLDYLVDEARLSCQESD